MKVLLLMTLLSLPLAQATEVTYLGTSDAGTEMEHALGEKEYEQLLSESLTLLDTTLEQNAPVRVEDNRKKFRLSMIVLGLWTIGQVGIGPFKLGAGIRHRSFYKRSL